MLLDLGNQAIVCNSIVWTRVGRGIVVGNPTIRIRKAAVFVDPVEVAISSGCQQSGILVGYTHISTYLVMSRYCI